jgi:zinc transporter ZupT
MGIVIDECFYIKVAFIFVVFFEALFTGLIPTYSKTCRESPKILGIANSFAAGVFLAIAFVHILPEECEIWEGVSQENNPGKKVFPLPNVLLFCGYTLILLIDKVMFDTHSLFEDDHDHLAVNGDPAEIKLANNVKASMVALGHA